MVSLASQTPMACARSASNRALSFSISVCLSFLHHESIIYRLDGARIRKRLAPQRVGNDRSLLGPLSLGGLYDADYFDRLLIHSPLSGLGSSFGDASRIDAIPARECCWAWGAWKTLGKGGATSRNIYAGATDCFTVSLTDLGRGLDDYDGLGATRRCRRSFHDVAESLATFVCNPRPSLTPICFSRKPPRLVNSSATICRWHCKWSRSKQSKHAFRSAAASTPRCISLRGRRQKMRIKYLPKTVHAALDEPRLVPARDRLAL